jgi:hypothetical protein
MGHCHHLTHDRFTGVSLQSPYLVTMSITVQLCTLPDVRLFADASKPPNRNPSKLARFAARGENGGKAVGSRVCATSITLANREQEKLAELTHEPWRRYTALFLCRQCLRLRRTPRKVTAPRLAICTPSTASQSARAFPVCCSSCW